MVLHINNDVCLAVDFIFGSSCLITWQEGMNPVVINSGGQRRILSSGEKATIKSCDVIELIPGSYYFKYVSDQRKFSRASNKSGDDGGHENAGLGTKRARESNAGASPGCLMVFFQL